jgi:hypothetical protein
VVLIFPVFIAIFLLKNYNKLGLEYFTTRFGSLYEELRINHKPALFYYVVFTLRRLLFAVIAVVFEGYPVFQI